MSVNRRENMMEKTICELFAGVGGFRLGFERQSNDWKTTWFSQWEPGAKNQWAHQCYVNHWGDVDNNTGIDIALVDKKRYRTIIYWLVVFHVKIIQLHIV